MKIQLAALPLLLSTMPFSFYKMKGPISEFDYNTFLLFKVKPIFNIHKPIYDFIEENYPKILYKNFYYDNYTNYVLLNPIDDNELTRMIQGIGFNSEFYERTSFLVKCPFNNLSKKQTESKDDISTPKFLTQEDWLYLNKVDFSQAKLENASFTRVLDNLQAINDALIKDGKQNGPIRNKIPYNFKVKNISTSGVLIQNNDDKITFTKGDKIVDFQKELKKYFLNYSNSQEIVDAIIYGQTESAKKDPYQLKIVDEVNRTSKILNKKESILALLNKSTILKVCLVFKNDHGKESMLFGIAKDNNSGQEFFWITDLGKNLSVLLHQ